MKMPPRSSSLIILFGPLLSLACGYESVIVQRYRDSTIRLSQVSYQMYQHAAATSIMTSTTGAGSRVRSGPARIDRQAALNAYLTQLVPAMKLSSDLAHIPREHPVKVDTTSTAKKWTRYYDAAKTQLRPNVKYEWSSNANPLTSKIVLSIEHVQALRANLDVVMWYRAQLDDKSTGPAHMGARKFALFLDYIVAGILEGLPKPPAINLKSGAISTPTWKLDEKRLREQLVMLYRYLFAKYQVYPQYEKFVAADCALLRSVTKWAYLMGAQVYPDWYEEMDVSLKTTCRRTRWKQPLSQALAILSAKAGRDTLIDSETPSSAYPDEEPCVITIPRPKPKKKPPPRPPKETPAIEIYIKQKDR